MANDQTIQGKYIVKAQAVLLSRFLSRLVRITIYDQTWYGNCALLNAVTIQALEIVELSS